jgi:hypothetical protein
MLSYHYLVMRVYQQQPIISQLQINLENEVLNLFITNVLLALLRKLTLMANLHEILKSLCFSFTGEIT